MHVDSSICYILIDSIHLKSHPFFVFLNFKQLLSIHSLMILIFLESAGWTLCDETYVWCVWHTSLLKKIQCLSIFWDSLLTSWFILEVNQINSQQLFHFMQISLVFSIVTCYVWFLCSCSIYIPKNLLVLFLIFNDNWCSLGKHFFMNAEIIQDVLFCKFQTHFTIKPFFVTNHAWMCFSFIKYWFIVFFHYSLGLVKRNGRRKVYNTYNWNS